jgi:superfamily II DNA or RNA helicase|tara:strand:+ start:502 stop:2994 length:2493 start_codon:yes stop_codon:yes gene_type:complete
MSISWVHENKKEFLSWINETFAEYKFTNKTTIEGKKMFKFQLFIRDYLQNTSPFRGVLIYHGLGSGKTCTSIVVAENLKTQRNILVLLPGALRPNFNQSLLSGECFTDDYKTMNNISKKYTIITYNANNTVQKLDDIGSIDNFLIVIDEAHNLIKNIVNQSKIGIAIYKKLRDAKNIKLVLLTGTPIVNKPFEVAIIANMLKGKMFVPRFIITKGVDLKDLDKFTTYLNELEYVNYCEPNLKKRYFDIYFTYPTWSPNFQKAIDEVINIGQKTYNLEAMYNQKESMTYTLFPESENDFDEHFVSSIADNRERLNRKDILRRRMVGLISYFKGGDRSKYPSQIVKPLIYIPMSEFQFVEYANIRYIEKKAEKGGASGSKTNLRGKKRKTVTSSMYRIYSRQFGNFVFPSEINKPFSNPKIEERFKSKKAGEYKNNNKDNKEMEKALALEEKLNEADENDADYKKTIKQKQHKEYQIRLQNAMKDLYDNKEKYLNIHNGQLDKLSPKMKLIFENINKNEGLVLVYSQFVTVEGLGVFSILLEANGYSRLQLGNKNNSISQRYCVYSGKESREDREEILKIFTNPKNKDGDICKIILVSESGAQGLDLKNIRQVHIMESFWHEVRIKQVIGRAVRYESHKELPPEKRNVEIYRYLMTFTDKQVEEFISMFGGPKSSRERTTSDEYIHLTSQKKEEIINEVLHVMKESAVDCELNKVYNEDNINCLNFGKETGISYFPDIRRDFIHVVEEGKKFKGKRGILLKDGVIVIQSEKKELQTFKSGKPTLFNKKLEKKNVSKKVVYDMNSLKVYDLDIYLSNKKLVELGSIGYQGKLI